MPGRSGRGTLQRAEGAATPFPSASTHRRQLLFPNWIRLWGQQLRTSQSSRGTHPGKLSVFSSRQARRLAVARGAIPERVVSLGEPLPSQCPATRRADSVGSRYELAALPVPEENPLPFASLRPGTQEATPSPAKGSKILGLSASWDARKRTLGRRSKKAKRSPPTFHPDPFSPPAPSKTPRRPGNQLRAFICCSGGGAFPAEEPRVRSPSET